MSPQGFAPRASEQRIAGEIGGFAAVPLDRKPPHSSADLEVRSANHEFPCG
jgi:hypothetical protein